MWQKKWQKNIEGYKDGKLHIVIAMISLIASKW